MSRQSKFVTESSRNKIHNLRNMLKHANPSEVLVQLLPRQHLKIETEKYLAELCDRTSISSKRNLRSQ